MKHIIVLLIALTLVITPAWASHDQGNGNSQDDHGEAGPPGQDGEQGPPGQDGNDGPQGPSGENGTDGSDGANGIDGQNGKDGLNGSDASGRNEFGYGIGADVVVYKTKSPLLTEVFVEGRYDIDNRETRVYGVAKVDLFGYLNKE